MSKRGRRLVAERGGIIDRYVSVTHVRHVNIHVSEDDSPTGIKNLFGTENSSNEPAMTFDQRITRCYELSFAALMLGAPEGSFLVHGSIHGPNASRRIGHAWLLLPNDLVWEPISALVHDHDEWCDYARAWYERTYSKVQAAQVHLAHGDYGRWHESRYP